jgi:hypothetical protein
LITRAAIYYTFKNFITLCMHHILNDCLVVIETNGIIIVSNALQNAFGYLNGINFGIGGDFTCNNEQIGCNKAFTGDL